MVGMTSGSRDRDDMRRLLDAGRRLLSELDANAVGARLLELARDLTGATYAALGVLDERRREFERFQTAGIDDELRSAIGPLPHGRGVLGVLISDPCPLRLDDIGSHPESYGYPQHHPAMTTLLGVPVRVRGDVYANLYLTDREGGPFTDADEEAATVLADWAGIAIGHAQAYGAERARRIELETAVKGLQATTDITRAVGADTDLDRVLELICKRSRALVDARFVLILLANEQRTAQTIVAVAGDAGRGAIGTEIPVEGSLTGRTLVSGQPVHASNLTPVIRRFGLQNLMQASVGLMVPLTYRGEVLGVLGAYDRTDGTPFTQAHGRLLEAFAVNAAIAVATAQSFARRDG